MGQGIPPLFCDKAHLSLSSVTHSIAFAWLARRAGIKSEVKGKRV